MDMFVRSRLLHAAPRLQHGSRVGLFFFISQQDPRLGYTQVLILIEVYSHATRLAALTLRSTLLLTVLLIYIYIYISYIYNTVFTYSIYTDIYIHTMDCHNLLRGNHLHSVEQEHTASSS